MILGPFQRVTAGCRTTHKKNYTRSDTKTDRANQSSMIVVEGDIALPRELRDYEMIRRAHRNRESRNHEDKNVKPPQETYYI